MKYFQLWMFYLRERSKYFFHHWLMEISYTNPVFLKREFADWVAVLSTIIWKQQEIFKRLLPWYWWYRKISSGWQIKNDHIVQACNHMMTWWDPVSLKLFLRYIIVEEVPGKCMNDWIMQKENKRDKIK